MTDAETAEEANSILRLMALSSRIIHMPGQAQGDPGSGGDIDCLAKGLDPMWPLRLGGGWRLCQHLHYDITASQWFLEREGRILVIDVLEDELGLGKYGFPTSTMGMSESQSEGARAAYLVAKRVRKAMDSPNDWRQIKDLAAENSDVFRSTLAQVFGSSLSESLTYSVTKGEPLGNKLLSRSRMSQRLRRFRTPKRAARITWLSLQRVLERLMHPTGLHIVLVGPDGVGKSSVAALLGESLSPFFRRATIFHWRPGILPRAGKLAGIKERDHTRPHDTSPRGVIPSTLLLCYYWLDFLIGSLFKILPFKVRAGLTIFDRGWWDIAVDPARYRLNPPPRLIRILGRALPRPDLMVVLEGDPETIWARKKEIPVEEIARQISEWKGVPRAAKRVEFVPVGTSLENVQERVLEKALTYLEIRSIVRTGCGWVAFPSRKDPRWQLPRGPRAAARRGMLLYQPVTFWGRAGWRLMRGLARMGFLRLFPRSSGLSVAALKLMGPHIGRGGRISVLRPNHPGRVVTRTIHADEKDDGVFKIITDGSPVTLRKEADALMDLGAYLEPPLNPPTLLQHEERLLKFAAARWNPRRRPWELPPEVAEALGVFYASAGGATQGGPAHGDVAPWNLLQTDRGWMLVDWEQARKDAPPFFDVWHHVVQAHALLGRPKKEEIFEGLSGRGTVGQAVAAYASGAGLDLGLAEKSLRRYLEITSTGLDAKTRDGLLGLQARLRLSSMLETR